MRAAILLLAVSGPSWAGVPVHPMVQLIQARPALQLAVAQELRVPSQANPWIPQGHALEVQKVALGLAAYRDQIPKEVMTSLVGPQAAAAVAKMEINPESLQAVLDDVGASDPAVLQRLEARLDEVFDKQFGGGMAAEAVLGKEAAVKTALGRNPSVQSDFEREAKDGSVERGTYKGQAAVRLTLEDGTRILAVRTGKAKSWTQARESARSLGEGWDLPVRAEYLPIKGSLPGMRVSMGEEDENGLYPMWLRTPDENANGPMRLAPILWGGDEFDAAGLAPYNVSPDQLARDIAAVESQLAGLGALDSDDRDRLRFLRATLKNLAAATRDGWPVYAVHVQTPKKKREVPPPSPN